VEQPVQSGSGTYIVGKDQAPVGEATVEGRHYCAAVRATADHPADPVGGQLVQGQLAQLANHRQRRLCRVAPMRLREPLHVSRLLALANVAEGEAGGLARTLTGGGLNGPRSSSQASATSFGGGGPLRRGFEPEACQAATLCLSSLHRVPALLRNVCLVVISHCPLRDPQHPLPGAQVHGRVPRPGALLSFLRETPTKAGDAGEDLVGGLDSNKRSGVLVPDSNPITDVCFQGDFGAMGTATAALLG
jgi:hypothetical protein